MPVNVTDPNQLRGVSVVGSDGEKIGKVDEVYLDNETNEPEWVAVKTGLFGSNVSLVPVAAADWSGEDLSVPFGKDKVRDAPNHDPGREISADDERELFTYYGVPYGGETVTATGGPDARATDTGTTDPSAAGTGYADGPGSGTSETTASDDAGYTTAGTTASDETGYGSAGTTTTDTTTDTGYAEESNTGTHRRDRSDDGDVVGHDTSGPTTDDAMTRSEERLHVGTESRESGRARLRKYITSETVSQTVPVSHEEVRVEREPITDANRTDALSGGDLTEEEHEVTLHEERPVVDKETVPVERVRLDTETVTEDTTVSEDVRKENIEVDGDTTTSSGYEGSDRH